MIPAMIFFTYDCMYEYEFLLKGKRNSINYFLLKSINKGNDNRVNIIPD